MTRLYYWDDILTQEYKAIHTNDTIGQLYKALTRKEQTVLKELLASGILCSPVGEAGLFKHITNKTGFSIYEIKQVLTSFVNSGLLLMLADPWRGQQWLMPYPIYYALYLTMLSFANNELDIQAPGSLHTVQCASPAHISVQLLLFVKQLEKQPLKLTKNNLLSKTAHKALRQTLTNEEQQYSNLAMCWEQISQNSLDIVHFFVQLCYCLKLISIKQNKIIIHDEQLDSWLTLDPASQHQWLWHVIVQLLLMHPSLNEAIAQIHKAVHHKNNWTFYENKGSDIRFQQLLAILCECGFVSYVKQQQHVYVQFHTLEDGHEQFALQDNGDVIVFSAVRHIDLWNLLSFCTIETLQETSHLTLSKDTLLKHCTCSEDVQTIKQWLLKSSFDPLPRIFAEWFNILQSISKWPAHKYEAMFFHDENNSVQQHFACRNLLDWELYMKPFAPLTIGNIASQQYMLQCLQVNGLDQIPKSWKEELRNYHKSTKRELIETAIHYGLALQLKYERQLERVLPIRIIDQNVELIVHQGPIARTKQLPVDNIEQLQITLD